MNIQKNQLNYLEARAIGNSKKTKKPYYKPKKRSMPDPQSKSKPDIEILFESLTKETDDNIDNYYSILMRLVYITIGISLGEIMNSGIIALEEFIKLKQLGIEMGLNKHPNFNTIMSELQNMVVITDYYCHQETTSEKQRSSH